MSNILSLENFDKALTRKKWDLKKLANEYDKKYPSENGKTIYYKKMNGHKLTPEQLTYNQIAIGLNYEIVSTVTI